MLGVVQQQDAATYVNRFARQLLVAANNWQRCGYVEAATALRSLVLMQSTDHTAVVAELADARAVLRAAQRSVPNRTVKELFAIGDPS